jgi:hypothetical protein
VPPLRHPAICPVGCIRPSFSLYDTTIVHFPRYYLARQFYSQLSQLHPQVIMTSPDGHARDYLHTYIPGNSRLTTLQDIPTHQPVKNILLPYMHRACACASARERDQGMSCHVMSCVYSTVSYRTSYKQTYKQTDHPNGIFIQIYLRNLPCIGNYLFFGISRSDQI